MAKEITMPSMGADMTEGTIVKWLKQEGDKVSKGDKLISISVEGGSEKIDEVKEVKKETEIPKDTEKIISGVLKKLQKEK